MKRILTAAVLIPLVLLAVFKAPNWLFTLLVGAVAILALKEFLDLVEAYGVRPMRWLSYIIVAFVFGVAAWRAWRAAQAIDDFAFSASSPQVLMLAGFAVLILFWPFLYLTAAMKADGLSKAFPAAAMSGFGVFYIGAALLSLAFLQGGESAWYAVVFTFAAVWAGDTVAMYTGKAIGRHKMSPRISPNKTWEGFAGSLLGSIVACILLAQVAPWIARVVEGTQPGFFRFHDHSIWKVVVAAAVLNLAAQLGDLVESLIKRGAGVKDSGTLLPGHGGILDRIDALLFAAPVALVVFALLR